MTGSWLIVKWAGIAVTIGYLVLLFVVILRFRGRLSQLRRGVILPVILGNCVSILPDIFESVSVRRVLFTIASFIYLYGFVILARALSQQDQKGLLKEGGAEEYVQSLNWN